MKLRYTLISLITTLVILSPLKASCTKWSIHMSSGIIRNFQMRESCLSLFAYYPEIQVERGILRYSNGSYWFSLAMYFGWWDDFIHTPTSKIADHMTYSYQSSILGARILLNSKIWNINWSLISGLSKNYIEADYIGGLGYTGRPGKDHYFKRQLFHFGINIEYPIFANTRIGIGCLYIFTTRSDLLVNPRLGFKINLRYSI